MEVEETIDRRSPWITLAEQSITGMLRRNMRIAGLVRFFLEASLKSNTAGRKLAP
jgi:hypothetical protein